MANCADVHEKVTGKIDRPLRPWNSEILADLTSKRKFVFLLFGKPWFSVCKLRVPFHCSGRWLPLQCYSQRNPWSRERERGGVYIFCALPLPAVSISIIQASIGHLRFETIFSKCWKYLSASASLNAGTSRICWVKSKSFRLSSQSVLLASISWSWVACSILAFSPSASILAFSISILAFSVSISLALILAFSISIAFSPYFWLSPIRVEPAKVRVSLPRGHLIHFHQRCLCRPYALLLF